MATASLPTAIANLRRTLERMEPHATSECDVLPFGVSVIDERLPGGGLALGHLHEVMEGGPASEYAGLSTLLVAGILTRLKGPVLWCLRGHDLFAPALSRVGLHPDRVIFCEIWKDSEVLPAMEEGLRCKGLAGVVGVALCRRAWRVVHRLHPHEFDRAAPNPWEGVTRKRRVKGRNPRLRASRSISSPTDASSMAKSPQLGQR